MNLKWDRDSAGDGWFFVNADVYDPDCISGVLFHVAARGENRESYSSYPRTRYCVFAQCSYQKYCGDIPLTYSEEEVKAMAIALWRLSENQE